MRTSALQVRAFDAVVIGAGPAGLMAAAALSGQGAKTLVLEQGAPARSHDRGAPRDLLAGVGGAGLFSDGKHSFFPSATALWSVPGVEPSFEETARFLRAHGIDAGRFPESPAPAPEPGSWVAKNYPSIHVPLDERLRMIETLWESTAERRTGARVEDAGRAGEEIILRVNHEEIRTGAVIVATGRLSPRWIRGWMERLGATFAFRRIDVGVRLEMAATSALFARLPGVDGKLRFLAKDERTELRTFCTCRDGEVVLGESGGTRAFSGRADGPPTGRSNVGLVLRSGDAAFAEDVLAALEQAAPLSFDLREWRDQGPKRLAPVFGERAAAALTGALTTFDRFAPELSSEPVRVYAPVIEGVGEYPVFDDAFSAATGVRVAGDVGGRFRGIVAAMVSGRHATKSLYAR